jgi:hypothetical protein
MGEGKLPKALVYYKNRIEIPNKLQKAGISWYHTMLCHPGINRTEETIGQHLWWPNIRDHITNYVKIAQYAKTIKDNKRIWINPTKRSQSYTRDRQCVDLIGP